MKKICLYVDKNLGILAGKTFILKANQPNHESVL